ncbi:MAG TPA: adenylate cyclase regulatory domain-containing protein [Solirubrobacteraceae bacterium]
MSDDHDRLLARLRDAGFQPEEIERADADGRAATLAVEAALGAPPRHTLTHVARESGLPNQFLRELMQAVGRPNPAPREKVYSDEDVEFAKVVKRFLDTGMPREGLLEVGRVTGLSMAQTAAAVRRLAGDALLQPGDSLDAAGLRYATAIDHLVPLFARQLDYHFRAHLRDSIRGQLLTESELAEGRVLGTQEVAVAFADLVDYTKLGEQLPPEDVGRIAGKLATLAVKAVVRPTQLVKTIGDAAMYVSPDPAALVKTCARLAGMIESEGEDCPALRIGVAFGPATSRGGDWFGAPVNVASRVTGVARPGQLYATEEVQSRAPEHPWKKKRKRSLRGVDGRVRLYALDDARLAEVAG